MGNKGCSSQTALVGLTPCRELWALPAHWALKKIRNQKSSKKKKITELLKNSPTQQCERKKPPATGKSHHLNCHCDHVTQYFQRTASEHVHNPHLGLNCELRLWDLQMRLLPYQLLWCEDSALLCCTWLDLFFPPSDLFRFLLFS